MSYTQLKAISLAEANLLSKLDTVINMFFEAADLNDIMRLNLDIVQLLKTISDEHRKIDDDLIIEFLQHTLIINQFLADLNQLRLKLAFEKQKREAGNGK